MDAFQRDLVEMLPRLRRLARSLARSGADADDLVQLALERALARRAQWSPPPPLEWWVMRIVKNAWIDETRSRGRRMTIFRPEEDGRSVADPSSGGSEAHIDRMAVERAMDALPEDQRVAVAMVLIQGLSYQEAAEILQVPAGTLNSRLSRGRAALIERLELEGSRP